MYIYIHINSGHGKSSESHWIHFGAGQRTGEKEAINSTIYIRRERALYIYNIYVYNKIWDKSCFWKVNLSGRPRHPEGPFVQQDPFPLQIQYRSWCTCEFYKRGSMRRCVKLLIYYHTWNLAPIFHIFEY